MVPKLNLKSTLTCEEEIHTKRRKFIIYSIYYAKQQQFKHKQRGRITSKNTPENQQYTNEETLQQSNFFKRFLKAAKVGAETTLSDNLFQSGLSVYEVM